LKELWVPLSAAIAQQRKVETIANNIANANTVGFKKDDLVFKEYLQAYEKGLEDQDLPRKEWKPSDFYKSYGAEDSQVKVDGSYSDFTQAELKPTGNPLDLGIQGKGFFEVLTPNGTRLTRNGSFTVSKDGLLSTDKGYPVLSKLDPAIAQPEGQSPTNRVIKLSNSKLNVTMEGDLFQDGKQIGSLSLLTPKEFPKLRKEGTSLFANGDPQNLMVSTELTIHQGVLEQSNVNAITEMSELIKANRHFESIQRGIKVYDSMSSKMVNDISGY